MNYHICDACGSHMEPRKQGAGKIMLAVFHPTNTSFTQKPQQTGNPFLDQLLGAKDSQRDGPEESSFDLCYECALAMAVTLKKQKADVAKGGTRVMQ